MKLYYIGIFRNSTKPAVELCGAKELSSFSFFERKSVGEFLTFFGTTVAERTAPGQRQSVEENEYIAHTYARTDGIAGVIVADKEYPIRVAYSLLNRLLDQFLTQFPRGQWSQGEVKLQFPELESSLLKYQNPQQADSIMRVQQELDETKIVLHKAIESVLQRGEELDSLVAKSSALSTTSKMFYKEAKKTNSCCIIV
ncbi:Longin-like domain-containing protein [Lipomyces kononenkoae]|uniref:Longin-like domain-containing protein n=1 Tax=Lipomyces kononenkoae TaxID=34357 RepID=A0ACC3SS32_LIPKO